MIFILHFNRIGSNFSISFIGSDKEKYKTETRYIITKLAITYVDSENQVQYVPKSVVTGKHDFVLGLKLYL